MDNLRDDIEKYLKGELSATQRHELEMRALNDPFLAEALEGAESINPDLFAEDINAINKKINSNQPSMYFWPLRIAASVLLIVSVTYLILRLGSEKNGELALQKVESPIEMPAEIISDSIEKLSQPATDLLSMKSEEKSAVKTQTKRSDQPEERKAKEIIQESAPVAVTKNDAETEGEAIVSEEKDEKEMALALKVDEVADKDLMESKVETARAKSKELKKSAAPIAVSGAGIIKTESAKLTTRDVNPEMSYESYQQYLKANVKYPREAIANKTEGIVTIGFIVNVNGILSDFVIEKGIGDGCNEELIRLIKEGPHWKPSSQNEKVSVSFAFELPN